jgi:thiosulfate dehydrogenase
MNPINAVFFTWILLATVLVGATGSLARDAITVDLTKWSPPDIADVGDDPFGKLVKYGHALVADTANQIGPTVPDPSKRITGNNLACQNCHLQAGTQPYAMPLTGIWGQYPQYRGREGSVNTIEDRINGCLERSMNGRALPTGSIEMQAFAAYMRWLSTGIPEGARLLGAGTMRIKEPARAADPRRGAAIYADVCSACHGADGLGQRADSGAGYQFPPLWGPDSYNNGAGMNRLLTAAAYAMHNMPFGTTFDRPVLTDADAYDVAAYLVSQGRPLKPNLDKDFPIRFQKPVDTGYGPYADSFTPEQHKFGPFEPIRARVKELAAGSGTPHAGGPDHVSDETAHVK